MNINEAIKRVEELYGYGSRAKTVTDIISQIHEPQKVVVPNLIGKWIEACKTSRLGGQLNTALQGPSESFNDSEAINVWLEYPENQETFARAWLDGYQVEKEELYTVEIPDPNADGYSIVLGRKEGKVQIKQSLSTTWQMNCSNQLTESEIKQDFEWAWQFAKEVEG